MPGLLDIAPPEIVTAHFEIRGGSIDVRGIRNREWAMLLQRFPELRPALGGGAAPTEDVVLSAIDGLFPAIIAAGLGNCGDKKTETLIRQRLSEPEQMAVFSTIMELTAPSDVRPLAAAAEPLGNGLSAKTTSPPQSSS